jgi:hypothetical protein
MPADISMPQGDGDEGEDRMPLAVLACASAIGVVLWVGIARIVIWAGSTVWAGLGHILR